jgi:hypothetical protein
MSSDRFELGYAVARRKPYRWLTVCFVCWAIAGVAIWRSADWTWEENGVSQGDVSMMFQVGASAIVSAIIVAVGALLVNYALDVRWGIRSRGKL